MSDSVLTGAGADLSRIREATCIHTRKIYDSCQSKDCLEDLQLYPTRASVAAIEQADTIKSGRARLLFVGVNVEPMGLNHGFYTVDLRYYYAITAQAYSGCTRIADITGLVVFDKRAVLFGSEGAAKVFNSEMACALMEEYIDREETAPLAVVEAVDPILLDMRLCCTREEVPCCELILTEVPDAIQAVFDSPLVLEQTSERRVYVSLGQFSILRLERDTQLSIPIYDYCIPDKECTCDRCEQDPCDIFQRVHFPVGQFFPPSCNAAYESTRETPHHCCD